VAGSLTVEAVAVHRSANVRRMPADRSSWVVDEVAYAGRENLDPAHVARYDGKMDAEAAGELAALQAAGLGGDATVIDMGAGTGQFALVAADVVRRVIAVDVSPVMLECLRSKLRSRGVGNVECVEGGFLTYEHGGEPADLVYSRFALHHLPDFWKAQALVRMADMLRPGGMLRLSDVVYGFEPAEAEACLERWISETASEGVEGGWTRAELEEHVRDEHSTFTWLLEPMLERAGFAIEEAEYSEDRILASYRCVKAA
jgi:ubiquinone/menaquinone biosynthesis C-methylase UbiE